MGFSTDTPTTACRWIITVRFANDSLATESGVTDVTAHWRRADVYRQKR